MPTLLVASFVLGGEAVARDGFLGFFGTDEGVVVVREIFRQRSRYSVHLGKRVLDERWSPYAGMVPGSAVYSMAHFGRGHSGLVDKRDLRCGYSGAIMNRPNLRDLSKDDRSYWPMGFRKTEGLEFFKKESEEKQKRRDLLLERRERRAEYSRNNNGGVIVRNYFRAKGFKPMLISSFGSRNGTDSVGALICLAEEKVLIDYSNGNEVEGLDEAGKKKYERYRKESGEIVSGFVADGFRVVGVNSDGKEETVKSLDGIGF